MRDGRRRGRWGATSVRPRRGCRRLSNAVRRPISRALRCDPPAPARRESITIIDTRRPASYHRRHPRTLSTHRGPTEVGMHRREFLTTATAGATLLAFSVVLRAPSKEPVRIGFPLPPTRPVAPLAP